MSIAVTADPPLTGLARRLGDAVVLTLQGALDPAAPVRSGTSVESVLVTVDVALEQRPRVVVVDVARVEFSRFVIGLLGLVRRRSVRAGTPLVLAAVSADGHEQLRRAKVDALYPAYPTVGTATGSRMPLGRPGRRPTTSRGERP